MIAPTPEQQIFMQDDVSTRLHHLAEHLEQVQFLWTETSSQDLMMPLVKESRYFLEWTVPDMVKADNIDRAAELVDLGRVLTHWLFHWDNIWSDAEQKRVAQGQTQDWLHRVSEIADTEPEALSA
ncbi:hypothetical protein PN465_10925 [Nodularia spumigena CS-584]|jgi:hypothetical protein|uniref:Uncharacterized protein n=2 Tax=Nodularia spumigena TaxID=70799 RepID=A0A2S0QB11_NODSP|nr:hypothetical protein [Nodularia spumigena]AHJ28567.1 hypothetical protein NSP_22350 [Nodularia spumigena CCY9414]AVZ31564.1 hypothetical protein BMF81_04387 [Nodularia spumigena UHCC 0039]EAW44652.1 hypothetical protein N9414_06284 [Nodularia spumigena CCY9414]MDB9382730.1 hypothetical protein [Nodularia spumigena CS-584]MEA5527856.1 hypothetical protein [Nodularia spumigena UHCC 0143]